MSLKKALIVGALAIAAAAGASSASATTCIGACGTAGADGVVTLSPTGNATYHWISTNGGTAGTASLGVANETNGSEFISNNFAAVSGDSLTFYFNYVTSDGSGFPDYAWSELQTATGSHVAWLFTATTTPSGNTSPGQGLPADDSTLTPATTPIIAGLSTWSPLGGSSGACYISPSSGCGYTDWIKSTYSIGAAGSYRVAYGTTNVRDTAFDSGLAFDGLAVNDHPVGDVPEPAAWALMLMGFASLGAALRTRRARTA